MPPNLVVLLLASERSTSVKKINNDKNNKEQRRAGTILQIKNNGYESKLDRFVDEMKIYGYCSKLNRSFIQMSSMDIGILFLFLEEQNGDKHLGK